jgi:predicted RNA methylase
MKKKMYTVSHNLDLLKEIDSDGARFTAKEHAYLVEAEFGETVFKTKEDLFRSELQDNIQKLGTFGFITESIKSNGYNNILSLGAGHCILEYLLKMSLPEEILVVACDFDSFLIDKAREFFPEIIAERFDFFEDDIESLSSDINIKFDLAVYFGSAYVMDDIEFIRLFSDLKKVGVKQIIDFHAGYMDSKDVMRNYLISVFRENPAIRKILGKPPIASGEYYRGKFHGYSRSRGELRRLYKDSGWELQKEMSISPYKYVAILG